MGYNAKFNWILKLKPEQGLDEGSLKETQEYSFEKDEQRIYPVDIPIHLVNSDLEAVGKVTITEFTVKNNKTSGKYRVLKIYNKEERDLITEDIKQ